MASAPSRPQYWDEIRILMLAAMAMFTYTIVIGILNGSDAVDFDQRRLLGHVHGGTLGWLTLSVFAASLWLFGEGDRPSDRERLAVRALVVGGIVTFAAYVVAFSTTYNEWRPALGTASTVLIVAFLVWVATRLPKTTLGVPHLGFLAALGTSIAGGVLGVLYGLEIATGNNYLPDGGEDAHPATMVVGFLVPVSLAMAEWAFSFPNVPKATRSGQIQMVFPFLGGIILMLALLLDITPLAPVAILLQVIGVGVFIRRLWPSLRGVDWMAPTPGRHAAFAAIAIIYVIGLAQFLIIRHEGDLNLAPEHQILSLDHSQFIGAVTNAVFAMLLAATMPPVRERRLDQVIFFAVNVGIVGFAAGLLFDATFMKRAFAPLMGVGLLFALAVYAWRLVRPAAARA